MTKRRVGILMNGVTGRMGTNQHLIRSISNRLPRLPGRYGIPIYPAPSTTMRGGRGCPTIQSTITPSRLNGSSF